MLLLKALRQSEQKLKMLKPKRATKPLLLQVPMRMKEKQPLRLILHARSLKRVNLFFRKPAVLHAVGVKSDTRYGLIPIIKGTSTYVDSIKFIKSLGIFVLPTGGISLKSTEVLDTDKVKAVIEQARNEFDYIIIDSPPAHVVSDSLVIAPLADGIIYNIRRDYAKVSEINRTLDEIRSADIEIIGAVFTMSAGEENSRYYRRKGYMRYGGYYGRKSNLSEMPR